MVGSSGRSSCSSHAKRRTTTTVALAAIPSPSDSVSTSQGTVATRRRRRRHHHKTQVTVIPPYGFSAEWLVFSQQPLRSIDLQFSTGLINTFDFSSDGSFLVSGGKDNCVRLWNIREILGGNVNSIPVQMDTEHGAGGVLCVAVSPNNRIVSLAVVHGTWRSSSTTAKREPLFV